ncbi:hypothetical protein BC827DRAFT_903758 [Russula dissimulans]|nr:hypothetical protein BC827DRAFT_903758 [Russula dissimulans]
MFPNLVVISSKSSLKTLKKSGRRSAPNPRGSCWDTALPPGSSSGSEASFIRASSSCITAPSETHEISSIARRKELTCRYFGIPGLRTTWS